MNMQTSLIVLALGYFIEFNIDCSAPQLSSLWLIVHNSNYFFYLFICFLLLYNMFCYCMEVFLVYE